MTIRRMLADGASAFGIALSDDQIDACIVYLIELEKWNRRISLTSIRSEKDVVIKHFLDSFSYVRGFRPDPALKLLDMGSGAGFPALPLRIAFPGLSVTLVESVRKKASFLRHIIRTLSLSDAVVLDERTDHLPEEYSGRFDVVTARAFAAMEATLKESARFLKPGAKTVMSRGPEEKVAPEAIDALGFVRAGTEYLSLPFGGDRRAIWIFRKKDDRPASFL